MKWRTNGSPNNFHIRNWKLENVFLQSEISTRDYKCSPMQRVLLFIPPSGPIRKIAFRKSTISWHCVIKNRKIQLKTENWIVFFFFLFLKINGKKDWNNIEKKKLGRNFQFQSIHVSHVGFIRSTAERSTLTLNDKNFKNQTQPVKVNVYLQTTNLLDFAILMFFFFYQFVCYSMDLSAA